MWLRGKGASNPFFQLIPHPVQPEFRGASRKPFYMLLWHIATLCEAFVARSGTIALLEPSGAHHSAPRISGCGNQAGRAGGVPLFTEVPALSPNCHTGTRPAGGSDGVF